MDKQHTKLADRLVSILIKLNTGSRVKLDSLADEHKVSRRTIERDFNRLYMLDFSETGACYKLNKGKQGHLSSDDIKRFANFASIQDLLPEVDRKFFQEKLKQSILVKGFEYEDIKAHSQEFDAISHAISENKIIEFNYTKVRQTDQPSSKKHRIEPYRLLNKNGIWYLVGLEKNAQRIFCFTQISELTVTDDSFVLNEDIKQEIDGTDSLFFGNQISEIVVQVEAVVAGYFERRDLLPNQELVRKFENGDLLLACKNIHPREILPQVQYWIPHIKIISPAELQGQLNQTLRRYLDSSG